MINSSKSQGIRTRSLHRGALPKTTGPVPDPSASASVAGSSIPPMLVAGLVNRGGPMRNDSGEHGA